MQQRILLVEDDASLRETVELLLERVGLHVASEPDGQRGLGRFRREQFDLVLLDLMLPGLDGLDVCREIRRTSRTPIVMLTAKADLTDVVLGLELGADDYVTKPFEGPELVARVRAVLRRAAPEDEDRLCIGDLEIDPRGFRVHKRGEEIHLSATEFRLLLELCRHAGQVLTREVLLERVWSYQYLGESRLIDMAMKRLRDKIEDEDGPNYITTVRGVGYRFERE